MNRVERVAVEYAIFKLKGQFSNHTGLANVLKMATLETFTTEEEAAGKLPYIRNLDPNGMYLILPLYMPIIKEPAE